MQISKKFLDWRQPVLREAVEYLMERYGTPGQLDLTSVVVVLPGARAARRLLELLVETTDERRIVFQPGDLVTMGQLPELLYRAKFPFANDLTQLAAWGHALRRVPETTLKAVVPHPPSSDDQLAWLELGDILRREHIELAADQLDFSKVAQTVARQGLPREVERWKSLAAIQVEYLKLLDGLELWDRQTARLVAVKQQECRIDRDLVLLGAVDLNRTLRAMLDAVADRVTALIVAPEKWESRFDEHGCLIPSEWQDVSFDFDESRLHLVDGPAQQAEAVVRSLAKYGGEYRADEITVGVPDENPELIAQIQRQLAAVDVPARFGPGHSVEESLPYRLLEGLAEYVDQEDRGAFTSLVRHPDVTDWLSEQPALLRERGAWLRWLDAYLAERYPQKVAPPWLGEAAENETLDAIYQAIQRLTEPLRVGKQPLSAWIGPLHGLIRSIYGQREFDTRRRGDRTTWRACEAIDDALATFDEVPAPLLPRVTATEALRLVLRAIGRATVAAPSDEPAVELLGWLELPLDDAPALVVTSLNEGIIPETLNADPFLPNAIRAELKLDDNDRRYARDAYALSVLRASREELDLIVAQRTSEGDPLAPSRLLLAGDGETVLRRVKLLFGEPESPGELRSSSSAEPTSAGSSTAVASVAEPVDVEPTPGTSAANATLQVPRWEAMVAREPALAKLKGIAAPLDELRVTQFRAYLECPYRFFLRSVLRLESATDDVRELDPLSFGSLLHDVLGAFGRSKERNSSSVETIAAALLDQLDRLVAARYGQQPLPAVRVQVEQIRLRLLRFAELQAQRCADGWQIVHVERERETLKAPFDVDGRPITLMGRIDRIDQHVKTKQYAVLDYKTSKSGDPPRRTHQRSGEWIDLQLPLYRYLAKSLDIEGSLDLGYVLLPGDPARAGFALAGWDESTELVAADEAARNVVRRIRAQVFWPPNPDFDPEWDEFAELCQLGVLGGGR